MELSLKDVYPLAKEKSAKGTRRLAREKALQIIFSKSICEETLDELFEHIYMRVFNFGDEEPENEKKGELLNPAQILELEGDIPIKWKQEEIEFGRKLVNMYYDNEKYTDKLLVSISDNWELGRIAKIDRLLIHIAVCEFMFFPNIPPKVSINESLEIAKLYSTDKSNVFINGVLEKIRRKLIEENKMVKEGRGLKNN
jgi:transcription antitermination factor NusB